jgi:hypothetical protein
VKPVSEYSKSFEMILLHFESELPLAGASIVSDQKQQL